MSWLRRLVVAVALAAFGTTVVLIQAPSLLESAIDPASLEDAIGTDGQYAIVAACGLLAVFAALWKGISASVSRPAPLSGADESGPDSAVGEDSVAGAAFEEAMTTATDGGWADRRERARERVDERLIGAATARIATVDGVDPERARKQVVGGEWTDDRVVTAFLGDETAPDAPLRWRLYEWLYEDRAYRRAIERTIDEIDAYGRDHR